MSEAERVALADLIRTIQERDPVVTADDGDDIVLTSERAERRNGLGTSGTERTGR